MSSSNPYAGRIPSEQAISESVRLLSESALDVICGFFHPGVEKQLFPDPVFDQFPLQEERGEIRNPRGLLLVVWSKEKGVIVLCFFKEFLDLMSGNRV